MVSLVDLVPLALVLILTWIRMFLGGVRGERLVEFPLPVPLSPSYLVYPMCRDQTLPRSGHWCGWVFLAGSMHLGNFPQKREPVIHGEGKAFLGHLALLGPFVLIATSLLTIYLAP